jgi:hypothetical protein
VSYKYFFDIQLVRVINGEVFRTVFAEENGLGASLSLF